MSDIKRKVIKDDDEFDIKKFLSRFIDHWKLFVVLIIFFLLSGFLFIRYSTPLYRIHAQILIQEDQNNSAASSFTSSTQLQDFSSLFSIQSNVSNELAIIQTRDLLEKMVRDMNLNISYYRKGRIRSVELFNKSPFAVSFIPASDSILETIFHISSLGMGTSNQFAIKNSEFNISRNLKWGDTLNTSIGKICVNKTGQPFEDANYFFTIVSVDETIEEITKNIAAEIPDKQTTIIDLTYNSNVPAKGEEVLKTLISKYLQRNLEEKNQISDSTIAFIDGRLKIVSAELNAIETRIQDFKQKNKLTDISEQSKVLINNSSDYYQKLNEVEVQLNVIKSMLDVLKDDSNNNRTIPSTLNNDPTFLALVEKYNSSLIDRDRLLLTTTPTNPYIQNLDVQIKNLRSDLNKSLQNQEKAYQISKDKIVAENSLISSTVQTVPVQERTYIGLTREQGIKQTLYVYLLQKKEETAITKASNIPSATVIATPKSEYLPYFPQTEIVMAVSLLLGLIVPGCYVLLKYILSSRIITREDITEVTECTILAEIGHSEKVGVLSMKTDVRSVLAEQFRIFRTNIDFVIGQKKCPVILITSSMTGEGKSFIAANLGQLYAYSGKRVLLMEMDLRKPKLSSMLEVRNDMGFTNYVISDKPVEEFIKPLSPHSNVFLMSSGPVPPNPAELLMLPKVTTMFEKLRFMFDCILLDTPPIGMVTDAQILNKHSDINLYVIRERYTFKNSAEIVNDLMDNHKFQNLYLIVNDVRRGASYKYGYGYGYGYSYGYGTENGNGAINGKPSRLMSIFKSFKKVK